MLLHREKEKISELEKKYQRINTFLLSSNGSLCSKCFCTDRKRKNCRNRQKTCCKVNFELSETKVKKQTNLCLPGYNLC